MSTAKHMSSVTDLMAAFLNQVIEADIAMQLKQYETWREAAKNEPILDVLKHKPGDTSSKNPQLVISDLLEGIDRLNNLALSETRLEIELEEIKPSLIKRMCARLRGRILLRHFRLSPTKRKNGQACIKLVLTVKRKPHGTWRVHREVINNDEIESTMRVPSIL
jgi:hypothetical protein